ncbi:hypothetical protein ABZP36_035380 [Zizania latifolia]
MIRGCKNEAVESKHIMSHQKHEATSHGDEEWGSKRPKGVGGDSEKELILNHDASQETNGEKTQKGDVCRKESMMNPCGSDEKETINSNVSMEPEVILTSIEADAAEDKGCRHAMEDAWVVLPDASMYSPGNLRSLGCIVCTETFTSKCYRRRITTHLTMYEDTELTFILLASYMIYDDEHSMLTVGTVCVSYACNMLDVSRSLISVLFS